MLYPYGAKASSSFIVLVVVVVVVAVAGWSTDIRSRSRWCETRRKTIQKASRRDFPLRANGTKVMSSSLLASSPEENTFEPASGRKRKTSTKSVSQTYHLPNVIRRWKFPQNMVAFRSDCGEVPHFPVWKSKILVELDNKFSYMYPTRIA